MDIYRKFQGVVFSKQRKKYKARITIDGERKHLGSFNTGEEAEAAYLKAKIEFADRQKKSCRTKGSKNKNPYPMTDVVLSRIQKQANNLRGKPCKHWIGRKHTKESKIKMSKSQTGKKRSEEAKMKMRERPGTMKGKKHTPEVINKMKVLIRERYDSGWVGGMSGKHHSDETKEKLYMAGIERVEKDGIKMNFNQGHFKPKNPSRYAGDPTRICFRSSWELKMMLHLDSNPNVIKWQSEEIYINYLDKATGKPRRYFPDFIVTFRHEDGSTRTVMAEIKPLSQVNPPKKKKRITPKSEQRYITEVKTYATNISKWEAAKIYCAKRGWSFQLLTENEIFFKPKEL